MSAVLDKLSEKGADILVTIEINFAGDQVDDVIVHLGDDPTNLAEAFVKKHKLPASAVAALSEHISNVIADTLSADEDEELGDIEDSNKLHESTPTDDERTPVKQVPQPSSAKPVNEDVSVNNHLTGVPPTSPPDLTPSSTTRAVENVLVSPPVVLSPFSDVEDVSVVSPVKREAPRVGQLPQLRRKSVVEAMPEKYEVGTDALMSSFLKRLPQNPMALYSSNVPSMNATMGSIMNLDVDDDEDVSVHVKNEDTEVMKEDAVDQDELSELSDESELGDVVEDEQSSDRNPYHDTIHSALLNAAENMAKAFDPISKTEHVPTQPEDTGAPEDIKESNPEDLYNRLKYGWDDSSVISKGSAKPVKGGKTPASGINRSALAGLPVSSSLALSKNGKTSFNTTRSKPAPNTANERLYEHGIKLKQKRELMTEEALQEVDRKRRVNAFKLNEVSRKLTDSSINNNNTDVGHRLHDLGTKEEGSKRVLEIAKGKIEIPTTWSCSKCGTLHKVNPEILHTIDGNILRYQKRVFNNLKADSVSMIEAAQSFAQSITPAVLENEIMRGVRINQTCTSCGWEQGKRAMFQPTNVSRILKRRQDRAERKLALKKEQETFAAMRESQVGSGECAAKRKTRITLTGNVGFRDLLAGGISALDLDEADSVEDNLDSDDEVIIARPGLFEELYQNTAGEARKMQQMNDRFKELTDYFTFKPNIPHSSKSLLKKQAQKDIHEQNIMKENNEKFVSNVRDRSRLRFQGTDKEERVLVAEIDDYLNPDLARYLAQPASERLYKNIPPVKHYSEPAPNVYPHSHQPVLYTHVNEKKEPMSPEGRKLYVDKLAYEYLARDAKIQKFADELYSYDEKTGQKLFHPKISAPPPNIQVSTIKADGEKRTIFDEILRRSEDSFKRKQEMVVEFQNKEKKEIEKSQAQACSHSNIILKQSTDRKIENLFKLLRIRCPAHTDDENSIDLMKISRSFFDDDSIFTVVVDVRNRLLKSKGRNAICSSNGNYDHLNPFEAEIQQKLDSSEFETPLAVTYEEFKSSMWEALKGRKGVGKAYLSVPKKKPVVTLQLLQEKVCEETFKPVINKSWNPREQALQKKPIGNILYEEAEKTRASIVEARKKQEVEIKMAHPFKPTLFKPPKSVQARYHGANRVKKEEFMDSVDGAPAYSTITIEGLPEFDASLGSPSGLDRFTDVEPIPAVRAGPQKRASDFFTYYDCENKDPPVENEVSERDTGAPPPTYTEEDPPFQSESDSDSEEIARLNSEDVKLEKTVGKLSPSKSLKLGTTEFSFSLGSDPSMFTFRSQPYSYSSTVSDDLASDAITGVAQAAPLKRSFSVTGTLPPSKSSDTNDVAISEDKKLTPQDLQVDEVGFVKSQHSTISPFTQTKPVTRFSFDEPATRNSTDTQSAETSFTRQDSQKSVDSSAITPRVHVFDAGKERHSFPLPKSSVPTNEGKLKTKSPKEKDHITNSKFGLYGSTYTALMSRGNINATKIPKTHEVNSYVNSLSEDSSPNSTKFTLREFNVPLTAAVIAKSHRWGSPKSKSADAISVDESAVLSKDDLEVSVSPHSLSAPPTVMNLTPALSVGGRTVSPSPTSLPTPLRRRPSESPSLVASSTPPNVPVVPSPPLVSAPALVSAEVPKKSKPAKRSSLFSLFMPKEK